MSYTPAPAMTFSLPMMGPWSTFGTPFAPGILSPATTPSSTVWSTANSARYLPMRLPMGVLVKRLWVAVGATGGTNTWDLGIYTDAGKQVVHMGATTAGTANTIQFMDIADTYLSPGDYYMAMSSNGTTATTFALSPTVELDKLASLYQTTAHPLPATATFATMPAKPLPLIGYCTTASP